MFQIYFDIEINNDLLTARMGRKARKAMKPALFAALRFWKKKYLPKHFTRQAYAIYGGDYKKHKRVGDPMVETGHFRDIVLRQPGKVHGTASSATARMVLKFGRPAKYSGARLKRKVYGRMKALRRHGVKETYEEAEGAILRKAGYGRERVEKFRQQLKSIHPGEEKEIKVHMKKVFVQQLKKYMNTKEKTRLGI